MITLRISGIDGKIAMLNQINYKEAQNWGLTDTRQKIVTSNLLGYLALQWKKKKKIVLISEIYQWKKKIKGKRKFSSVLNQKRSNIQTAFNHKPNLPKKDYNNTNEEKDCYNIWYSDWNSTSIMFSSILLIL